VLSVPPGLLGDSMQLIQSLQQARMEGEQTLEKTRVECRDVRERWNIAHEENLILQSRNGQLQSQNSILSAENLNRQLEIDQLNATLSDLQADRQRRRCSYRYLRDRHILLLREQSWRRFLDSLSKEVYLLKRRYLDEVICPKTGLRISCVVLILSMCWISAIWARLCCVIVTSCICYFVSRSLFLNLTQQAKEIRVQFENIVAQLLAGSGLLSSEDFSRGECVSRQFLTALVARHVFYWKGGPFGD
jgi:hypothetical protein